MKRPEQRTEHPNHERWLVSYADFVTLLFAFFVVMFASTQTDRKKVSDAVKRALHGETPRASSVLGGTVDQAGIGNAMRNGPGGTQVYTPVPQSSEFLPSQEFLDRELEEQIAEGQLTVHIEARGMVVSLRDAGFFVSGSDELSPAIMPVLAKIAETVLKTVNSVRIEGHTDSVPIHSARFRSNWELSTARSIATLEALHNNYGIPIERMAVAGYASNFPVDTNGTPEGRAKNRRVDIVILSQTAVMSEAPTTHR